MAKSYVPTLARISLRLLNYINKHQATLNTYLSASQQQALTNCLPCLQTLAALVARETP